MAPITINTEGLITLISSSDASKMMTTLDNKKMPRKTQGSKKRRSKVGTPGELDDNQWTWTLRNRNQNDMECADAAASAEKKTTDAAAVENTKDADAAVEKRTKDAAVEKTKEKKDKKAKATEAQFKQTRPAKAMVKLVMMLVMMLVMRLVMRLVRLELMVVRIKWVARLPRVVAKAGRRLSQTNSPMYKKMICASGRKNTSFSTTKMTRSTT